MTKLNYVKVGEVEFKSGVGIIGDPCYWWTEDNSDKMQPFDYYVNDYLLHTQFAALEHNKSHYGAGMVFKTPTKKATLFIDYANEKDYGKYTNGGRPAIYVISFDGSEPPIFTEFVDTDISLDVDAGITYFGDLGAMFGEDDPPVDICGGWSAFCEKYFDRSGYNKSFGYGSVMSDLFRVELHIESGIEKNITTSEEFLKRLKWTIECVKDSHPEVDVDFQYVVNNINDFEKIKEYLKSIHEKYDTYNGYSMYTYDSGENLGCVVDTNFGDGSYPVYVKYNEQGEVTHFMVVYERPSCYRNTEDEEDEEDYESEDD